MTLREAVRLARRSHEDFQRLDKQFKSNNTEHIELMHAWEMTIEAAEQSLTPANPPPSSPADLFDRLLVAVVPSIPYEGSAQMTALYAVGLVIELLDRRKQFLGMTI